MTTSWDSLFLPSVEQDAIAATLRQSLEDFGYTLYDPFGLLPGRSYARSVRLFVAPPAGGWVRVIGTPDPRLLMPLSASGLCMYLALTDSKALIEVYARGDARQPDRELLPYLRAGLSADDLRRALHDELPATTADHGGLMANLPDDVQALAGQVDAGKAQKMFDRLSSGLLRKAGSDAEQTAAAQAMLCPPDWGSPGGQRILAVVDCLTFPASWRAPDFVTLRDAYQLYARRRRKPDARLYPGDEDTMAAVPNALDYIPVYGGQND